MLRRQQYKASVRGKQDWRHLSKDARAAWEIGVQHLYLFPRLERAGRDDRAASLLRKWGGSGMRAGPFLADLQERTPPELLSASERGTSLPLVWSFQPQLNQTTLQKAVFSHPDSASRFPALSAVLRLHQRMASLRFLPQVTTWANLVASRFSRRMTLEQARSSTVRSVVAGLPDTEAPKWQAAFSGFCAAWNCSRQWITHFECQQIPKEYTEKTMSDEVPISFAAHTEKDEGIIAFALQMWLVETHNAVVEMTCADSSQIPRLSSRLAQLSDVCTFGKGQSAIEELIMFANDRCVGDTGVDLLRLERHVRASIGGKPIIALEVPQFIFVGDEQAGDLGVLNTKVAQRQLPPSVAKRLRADLASKSSADSCRRTCQVVLSFLASTGGLGSLGDEVATMSLSRYCETVLLLSEELPSTTAATEVLLCHLEAFLALLDSLTADDPFASVSSKYREDISPDLEQELLSAAPNFDLQLLLPALRSLASSLVEEHLAASEPLRDVLSYVGSDQGDIGAQPWFDTIPFGLELRHARAVHSALAASYHV